MGLGLLSGVAEAQLPHAGEIVVNGERTGDHAGLDKLMAPIVDLPISISQVGSAEIEQRGITTLTDAVRGVPGISLGAGETSWQGNNLYLRGFTTRNDTFLDGMRDYGYYFRDPFNDAAIEVLKGPNSILFGRGATGGAIHQVSKQPTLKSFASAEFSAGTDGTLRTTTDLDLALGRTTALRLDGMATRAEVTDRDGALNRRWGIAPTIAFGVGTPTRLTLSYFHQSERNRPDYGIPWFNSAPAAVDRDSFYGFKSDYLNTDVDIGTVKLAHDLSSAFSLSASLRYSSARRSFRTSEAAIPATTAATTPLSAIQVTRNEFSGYSDDRFLQGQIAATAHFRTGPVAHMLTFGIEGGQEKPAPTYIFHVGVIGSSLVNPPEQAFAEASQYVRFRARTTANTVGLYALDTIELGQHVQVLAGLRWDSFDAHYRSTGYDPTGVSVATTDVDRNDRRISGRGALIYTPDARSSLYVTYANSFNPSAEGIESLVSAGRSVAQANLNARPETSRAWEAGAKRKMAGGRLLLTAAIFRTIKSNVRIPDPTIANFNTNGGTQRVQGIELEATGQITEAWTIHASYAYLDSSTLHVDNPSAAGSPRIGAQLPVTPKNSASFQTDYALSRIFSVGGGAVYQSSRLGQNTNSSLLRAPGYTVYELRARAQLSPRVAVQANIFNLTDKLYYDQLHPFHVVPGAGRSALFSLIVKTP